MLHAFYIFVNPFVRTIILISIYIVQVNILITEKLLIQIFSQVHQNIPKNYPLNNLIIYSNKWWFSFEIQKFLLYKIVNTIQ